MKLDAERHRGFVPADMEAEGFRPPSILSVLSLGLEPFLPNKVTTSPDGDFKLEKEPETANPDSLLFGKVDLLFNIGFVLSLLGLIFCFNAISGEKENSTLRLIMANSVPRWQIITAKLVGHYAVLVIPLFISLMAGVLILSLTGPFAVFSGPFLPSLAIFVGASLLFVLAVCNLGLLISTLTHRSITSMVTVFFVWTVLVLSWPRISPMIATILSPVKSQQVYLAEKAMIRQNIEKELDGARRETFDRIVTGQHGLSLEQITREKSPEAERAKAAFGGAREELERSFQERLRGELDQVDREYENRRRAQVALTRNIARLSPVTSYAYIVSEAAGTGMLELRNFQENARRFQAAVKAQLYDKMRHEWYGSGTRPGAWRDDSTVPGFDPEKEPLPQMRYQPARLSDALRQAWPDALLLCLFNIVFFAAAYFSFARYDVR